MRNIISFILFLTLYSLPLQAMPEDAVLKKMIGRMLVIGFDDATIDAQSAIVQELQTYELGGVILFDRFYKERERIKNISSPAQLQELTKQLKHYAQKPLLISIDQEGGKVARLKKRDGFSEFPSAFSFSKSSFEHAKERYTQMAQMLKEYGINCDFGPVVDLAINAENRVIVGLERSYGKESEAVTQYAQIFSDALKSKGVISVLKHFPGHGSSLGDSHQGFVDVTQTWSEKELEPYQNLINTNTVSMIMSAHVYNAKLDDTYPATLSYAINSTLLRGKMHYHGVLISDDLQMEAIANYYTLKETVTLAINSGIDMLLFGNQLSKTQTNAIVETIFSQIKSGKIPLARILEANERIARLPL
ncbi:glycoside hydrolase family 3 N-terminal domain-containing protein [Sulfurospirillum multivorans]|uniref:beta-N-acetylhexosaminidase n=2 Tax=Sulfurospirillum multivorans TaxID=66821 RepID=A0AA86AR83_SULMK|nr:glycoside hydrolase family 3 N-terminal domain-containing protein [Sulfurospirillum multivorans]AHJ14291.1 beta-glucosidase-related glycosidase [Sulfurospirillum multivorans DSM 12446]QEH07776.1 beta-glucosidase-related glycosidase [Sulfurospirillum multivorans]